MTIIKQKHTLLGAGHESLMDIASITTQLLHDFKHKKNVYIQKMEINPEDILIETIEV